MEQHSELALHTSPCCALDPAGVLSFTAACRSRFIVTDQHGPLIKLWRKLGLLPTLLAPAAGTKNLHVKAQDDVTRRGLTGAKQREQLHPQLYSVHTRCFEHSLCPADVVVVNSSDNALIGALKHLFFSGTRTHKTGAVAALAKIAHSHQHRVWLRATASLHPPTADRKCTLRWPPSSPHRLACCLSQLQAHKGPGLLPHNSHVITPENTHTTPSINLPPRT